MRTAIGYAFARLFSSVRPHRVNKNILLPMRPAHYSSHSNLNNVIAPRKTINAENSFIHH